MSRKLDEVSLYLTPEQRAGVRDLTQRARLARENRKAGNKAVHSVEVARAELDRAETAFREAVQRAMDTPFVQVRAVEFAARLSRPRLYQIKHGTNGH